MKQIQQKSKRGNVIRFDLWINAVIIILGIIALLYFRGHIAAAYTYLQDIDLFVVATIPVLILLVFLSFFTDIRYVMSEEPSFVVERYAFIWVMLKIISIVFFLLSLLLVVWIHSYCGYLPLNESENVNLYFLKSRINYTYVSRC